MSQDFNSVFYTMTPATTGLTTTVVGSTGIDSSGLMAVNANGSQIFTTQMDSNGTTTDLVKINPTTGAGTVIGNTGYDIINGLFVGNTLYGFDLSGAIVQINTATGAATQTATYTLPNGDAIYASALVTTASVPEP